jgi:hypothetical protein
MVKGQVCAIKTMMDGDVRITVNIPSEVVPRDIIDWRFEDVVIVTKPDIRGGSGLGGELGSAFDEK